MNRFVLTGTPGSGKTAILRQLELDGLGVVEEAATDVIAVAQARGVDEPWQQPDFTEAIAALQRRRQLAADRIRADEPVFFDRSPVCTYALALFLGHPVGPVLAAELDRVRKEHVYERRVFFVVGQGFVTPTPARRITPADAARFEELHAKVYRSLGYELIPVEPGPLDVRADFVRAQASTT
ncbi:putative ATPase [Catenulispora sp. GAS73]|uniref:AAA family ATPase n=1 Tax=Catenulispora sp. GAS73 TaxID=3156269 RepID=UPI003514C822